MKKFMLSEISQTEKDIFCIISVIQKSKIITEVDSTKHQKDYGL